MLKFTELKKVKETEHLMPNLASLAIALFGDDAIFLDRKKAHLDTSTGKKKFADGLVWLPWQQELWLVEAEWHMDNLDEQLRAFLKGKHDRKQLEGDLRPRLQSMETVLSDPLPQGYREYSKLPGGFVLDSVVRQTLDNHYHRGRFRPHFWLVLGHDGENLDDLLEEYTEDVSKLFTDVKFIISSVRMFQSRTGGYLLLEQNASGHITPIKSILLPSVTSTADAEKEPPSIQPPTRRPGIGGPGRKRGQAAVVWDWIRSTFPGVDREGVRLRIEFGDEHSDFKIDWEHPGSLMVTHQGRTQYPAAAAKSAMPGAFAGRRVSNLARHCGWLVDTNTSPSQKLARYREIEFAKWRRRMAAEEDAAPVISPKNTQVPDPQSPPVFDDEKVEDFFRRARTRTREELRVERNIIAKPDLWKRFIADGQMTKAEMRLLGIKGKGCSGFWHFLDRNKVAKLYGETWVLNRRAVQFITQWLPEQPDE